MNIFLLKNHIRNILICTALASTLVHLHAAESQNTSAHGHQIGDCAQKMLMHERFKHYVQQVQSEYGFKDEVRYLKEGLCIDNREKALDKLKTQSLAILKANLKEEGRTYQEHSYNLANLVCMYRGIKNYALTLLNKNLLDALAPEMEQVLQLETQVNANKLKPESLKAYHYYQECIAAFEKDNSVPDFQLLGNAMQEALTTSDPELQKWFFIPFKKYYRSLTRNIDSTLDSFNNHVQSISKEISLYNIRYKDLYKRMPITLLFNYLSKHIPAVKESSVAKTVTKQIPGTINNDEIKKLMRFLLLTEPYEQVISLAYDLLKESYEKVSPGVGRAYQCDPVLSTLLQVLFNQACIAQESKDECAIDVGNRVHVYELFVEVWRAKKAREKQYLATQPISAASDNCGVIDKTATTSITTMSQSHNNSITKAVKKHSHKKKIKKKKYKPAESTTTTAVVDQQPEIPLIPAKELKNTKMKIASDGSYYMTSDDHHDQITVHSLDDTIQATLWKKKNVSTYDIGTIRYSDYVLQWLNNPKQASAQKTFTDEQDKAYSIAIHTFPRLVDQYIEQLGSTTLLTSRTSDQNEVRAVWIPGTYTIEGTTHYGLFVYLFDQNGICFHRMFEKRTHHELFQDIQQTNALSGYVVPNKQ